MKTSGFLVLVTALLALANVTSAEEAIRLSNAEMDNVTAGVSNHLVGSSIGVEFDGNGIRAKVGGITHIEVDEVGGVTRIEVDGVPVAVGRNGAERISNGHHIAVANEDSRSATATAKGPRSATAIAVARGKNQTQSGDTTARAEASNF